jgi:hypothetical protein
MRCKAVTQWAGPSMTADFNHEMSAVEAGSMDGGRNHDEISS